MHIGSHSYDHYWLDSLAPEQQAEQINLSMSFLKSLGCDMQNWTMCYPHGGYNENTVSALVNNKCALGLTCEADVADLDRWPAMELPRIDTNSIPHSAG
jgi:peptidoglycan/xylan/chitin deacetylase (PgdA/CDA1 family)